MDDGKDSGKAIRQPDCAVAGKYDLIQLNMGAVDIKHSPGD